MRPRMTSCILMPSFVIRLMQDAAKQRTNERKDLIGDSLTNHETALAAVSLDGNLCCRFGHDRNRIREKFRSSHGQLNGIDGLFNPKESCAKRFGLLGVL